MSTNEGSRRINGRTMDQWLGEVDRIIIDRFGLSVHDLVDWPIYDTWEGGLSPLHGAQVALESDDIVGLGLLEEFGDLVE